jgi:hypothetical protein
MILQSVCHKHSTTALQVFRAKQSTKTHFLRLATDVLMTAVMGLAIVKILALIGRTIVSAFMVDALVRVATSVFVVLA